MKTQWDRRSVQAPQVLTQVKPALEVFMLVYATANTSKILMTYINYVKYIGVYGPSEHLYGGWRFLYNNWARHYNR